MSSYTVYFDGYVTVQASSEVEAKIKVSEELDNVAESYEITDVTE